MSERIHRIAENHIVFEESCADVDEAQVNRLAALLESVRKEEEDWWHKQWHQATGIPCDATSEYCPREVRRRQP
jgi:hypothetical protein